MTIHLCRTAEQGPHKYYLFSVTKDGWIERDLSVRTMGTNDIHMMSRREAIQRMKIVNPKMRDTGKRVGGFHDEVWSDRVKE